MLSLRVSIKRNNFIYVMFDLFILLYFCAYFYDSDVAYFHIIRRIALLGVAFWGVIISLKKNNVTQMNKCTIWYFAFVLYAISSILWADDSSKAIEMFKSLINILTVGICISARLKNTNDDDIKRLIACYIFAVLFRIVNVGIKMIGMYSLSGMLGVRFGDTAGYNSNETAVEAVIVVFLSICLIKDTKYKFFYTVITILCIFIVAIAGSKKGILGLVLGYILYRYFQNKNLGKIKILIVGIGTMFLAYMAMMNIPFLYETFGRRFEAMLLYLNGNNSASASTSERMILIFQGLNIWKSNFISGVGLNNFSIIQTVKEDYYAHCNYVELAADLGCIGLLLYYWFPLKTLFIRKKEYTNLELSLKTVLALLLILDIAMVSYMDVSIVILYWLIAEGFKCQIHTKIK